MFVGSLFPAASSRVANPSRCFSQGALETASHWNSALELLHHMEMTENSISPNIRSFNSAMRSCEEEWEKAIVLFDMLRVFDWSLENIGKKDGMEKITQKQKHTFFVGWKQTLEKIGTKSFCFLLFLGFEFLSSVMREPPSESDGGNPQKNQQKTS